MHVYEIEFYVQESEPLATYFRLIWTKLSTKLIHESKGFVLFVYTILGKNNSKCLLKPRVS